MSALYPEKTIDDIPGYENLTAREIVAKLGARISLKHVLHNQRCLSIEALGEEIVIETTSDSYHAKNVVIATGLGDYAPRKIGLDNEDICKNIVYFVRDLNDFRDKNVLILGGGDAAIDWAFDICGVAKTVTISHRRNEFRGNIEKLEGLPIRILTPYVPSSIVAEGKLAISISLKKTDDGSLIALKPDIILVNYGLVPSQTSFGLPISKEGLGFETGDLNEVVPHVYAIGDCNYKLGKRKRIAEGFKEAEKVFAIIASQREAER